MDYNINDLVSSYRVELESLAVNQFVDDLDFYIREVYSSAYIQPLISEWYVNGGVLNE